MNRRAAFIVLGAIALSAIPGSVCVAQEFYYDLDTTYTVTPSDLKIAVQFDTTVHARSQSEFYIDHPCLDPATEVSYVDRGYWVYGLNPSYGYEASAGALS